MKLFEITELKRWWKYHSNKLAVTAGLAAAALVELSLQHQAEILVWVAQIDQPWRSMLTFVVIGVVPVLVRMMKQPKLEVTDNDNQTGDV